MVTMLEMLMTQVNMLNMTKFHIYCMTKFHRNTCLDVFPPRGARLETDENMQDLIPAKGYPCVAVRGFVRGRSF